MKHKSNVAAGKFLIIVLSLVAFHFYSLILHSSLWGGKNPNNNRTNLKGSRKQCQTQFNDIFNRRQGRDKVTFSVCFFLSLTL